MWHSSHQDYNDANDDVRPGQENIFPAVQLQRLHVLHRLSGNLESPGNVMDDQPFCPCSMPSHRHNMLHYYWHCRVVQCRPYGLTCPRTPGSPCCSSTWRAQPGIARGSSGRFPTWLPGGLFHIVCSRVYFAFPGSSIRVLVGRQVSIVTQQFDSKNKD